jgi:multiple sugar transport system substrate-binding protein
MLVWIATAQPLEFVRLCASSARVAKGIHAADTEKGAMRTRGSFFLANAVAFVSVLVATVIIAPAAPAASTPTITWYARPESGGSTVQAAANCNRAAHGRYHISISPLPADATQQREQLVRRLAANDSGIDLISMDVVWTAEFAGAKWIVPWSKQDAVSIGAGVIPAVLKTGEYRGRMYGAPLNTGSQLLWYRKDLVPNPPKTWDEMLDMAAKLPSSSNKIEVQAARYEGYTVWFNSLLASAGGRILDSKGKPSLAEGPTVKALSIMKRLATSSAADPSLSNQREDTADQAFNAGRAAFMVNYPFVYAAAKSDAPKIFANLGVAPWPSVDPGKPARVTLGGFNLGVGRFSSHKALAFAAGRCLLNDRNQIVRATKDGLPPVKESLYDDPQFTKANPFAPLLLETFRNGSQRPSSPAYNDISLAVLRALHPPRSISPKSAAKELRSLVDDAVNSRGLL